MNRLARFRRIVIKIGSSLLVDRATGLRHDWLASVAADIAGLRRDGAQVLVVSSGAIALGRGILGRQAGALKLEESQASAACGQIALARAWAEALGRHAITAGQVLLTLGDTEERRRYLNARETLSTLLKLGAVPVINENDTVATTEIRYGDNDRLAARVATMAGADLLILLSDVDGLYTAPPESEPRAAFVPHVTQVTPAIEAMAGAAGSDLSRGGMVTKIEAAKIATASGTAMAITSGKRLNPVAALAAGERATWFAANGNPVTARKKWISGQLAATGAVFVDDGAVGALRSGKSLLPAGVSRVDGAFARGDVVVVRGLDGGEVGRGIVAYDAADAARIAGCKSRDIAQILGYEGRSEMIHRDDLVLRALAAGAPAKVDGGD
ncbi:MAG: glutamate 5-kinase [Alphaproteobacteria bacterium]|nr:MAG: glutamate 5-kinase [Alphaproteobacteria bacterium]